MKTLGKITMIMMFALLFSGLRAYCDEPLPPAPPARHGEGGNNAPAGAPIDGGLGILLAMGAAWGGAKHFRDRNRKK